MTEKLADRFRREQREAVLRQHAPSHYDWLMWATSAATMLAVATSVAIGFTEFLNSRRELPPLEQRISELTDSLQKSSRSISDIEQEIEQRKSLVDQLREDAKIAEGLKTLNKEQVDAVAATLRGQLQVQSDESWWSDVGMNVFFTLLGTILGQLTWVWPWLRQRWAKTPPTAPV